jgi:peptidoglycan/xylan/chitin deacetylase (PgdA/CDA1 family)
VTATFFVVGEHVRRYPSVVRDIRDAGHEVASHGYRHRNHFFRNPAELFADIHSAQIAVEDVLGERPALFRPPQGAVTLATRAAAALAGVSVVLWTTWGRDWRPAATPVTIVRDVTHHLSGGAIILLHDGDYYSGRSWRATFDALPSVILAARSRGLHVGQIGGAGSLGW